MQWNLSYQLSLLKQYHSVRILNLNYVFGPVKMVQNTEYVVSIACNL